MITPVSISQYIMKIQLNLLISNTDPNNFSVSKEIWKFLEYYNWNWPFSKFPGESMKRFSFLFERWPWFHTGNYVLNMQDFREPVAGCEIAKLNEWWLWYDWLQTRFVGLWSRSRSHWASTSMRSIWLQKQIFGFNPHPKNRLSKQINSKCLISETLL